MQAVLRALAIAALGLQVSPANADANDGELFGNTLGERHDDSGKPLENSGRLLSFVVSDAIKPALIDIVYVMVTPVSNTVGKIAGETWYESGEDAILAYERFRSILRKKYSDWETDERSELHYQGSRFWSGDYVLGVQASGPHSSAPVFDPGRPFQLVISMSYLPATRQSVEFEALAAAEIKQVEAGLYTEEDVRGL